MTAQPYTAFAVLDSRAGRAEDVERAIRRLAPRVRAEEGCSEFRPSRSTRHLGRCCITETCRDRAAIERHLRTRHVEDCIASLDAITLDGRDAADPTIPLDETEQHMDPEQTFPIALTVDRSGSGRPVMVLHGGGGPASVAPLVRHLAADHDVIAPTIPGWNGTDRPGWLTDVDDVALAFLDLLRDLDLTDVTLVGSSIGGWIASTMAVLDADRGRIGRLCIVDAVGIEVPGEPIRDFFALDAHGVAEYSFHDADRFFVDPGALTDQQRAAQQQNMATMRTMVGDPYMHDPHLVHRLGRVTVPVLALWGDSDRIVTPAYGRAFAAAFRDARFEVVEDAGHLPHIEQPEATSALLDPFVDGTEGAR